MSHIPPSAAIFSPSIARLASSAAKNWSQVDSWLATKFPGRPPPPFERNSETLKVLVALAVLNETVDEDHTLIASLEASALHTLASSSGGETRGSDDGVPNALASPALPVAVVENISLAIEDNLSREGLSAFGSLAATSVELGVANPSPALLGCKIAELQTRLFRLEQALARNDALREYIEDESEKLQIVLRQQEHGGYRPSTSLAKLNLDLQRKVKKQAARLQDAREKANDAGQSIGPTVQQLEDEEAVYLELMAYGQTLDDQIKPFQGLPPDTCLARQQLEALRSELHSATQRRDIVFEGLAERATPKRSR
ncbi:hypothetical protein SEUCBS139899_010554 [Sporothrix eucalyptigena]